ncbi:MAG TPA: VWA domain-containing protein, partial [Verrucomicrobiae bacterium]|nr:VWA domain-containing protein [Verrucomicrobiae bacterium]
SGRQPAFLYSSVQLVKGIIGITRSSAGGMLMKLRWLALACFIVALAQPRMILSESTLHASGVDIVVALDLSGSMMAEDDGFVLNGQQATRFQIAKDTLKKFIAKRPNDRLGLVIFATHAFVVVPPTLDHDFFSANLERLQMNMEGFDDHSTAIGSALATSLNRLRELKSKSKVVILLTDGENNAGKVPPLTAAEAAAALGIKVYTIGVGTRGEARIQQSDIFGNKHYVKIPVDVDEETLTKIANMTGGKYYRADSSATLNKIYADIDRLEKTDEEVKKYTQYNELFSWVIIPGLFFVLLENILSNTIWRKLP